MKRFVFLMCAAILCITSYAQSSRRQEIIDSLTVRIIRNPLFWDTLIAPNVNFNSATAEEKINIEYILFRLYAEALHENTKNMPTEYLSNVLEAIDMPIIRFCWSKEFYTHAIQTSIEALRYELEGGTNFTYNIKDDKADELINAIRNAASPLIEYNVKKLNEITSNATISPQDMIRIQQAGIRVTQHTPEILVKVLSEHFSCEEFLPYFSEQAFVYGLNLTNVTVDYMSDKWTEAYIQEMAGKIMSESDKTEKLCRYIELSRSVPHIYFPKRLPIIDIKGKKYTYKGQSKEGLPHGKGTMITNKGVIYTGDFRNGKRHGLLEVTNPGSTPVLQVWVKDKYMKQMTAYPDETSTIIPYTENLMGYHKAYDAKNSITIDGFFIDGKLNGKGVARFENHVMKGEFEDGEFTNGIISYQYPEWKTYVFRGIKKGEYLIGDWLKESIDGAHKEKVIGTFINDVPNDRNTIRVVRTDGTWLYEGYYAYGELYGKGRISYNMTNPECGIKDSLIYEGNLVANQPHGEGHAEIHLKDIPKGIWYFFRYGIRLEDVPGEKNAEIHMTGKFDNGNFGEGRIETSYGLTIEGSFKEKELYNGKLTKTYNDNGATYEVECTDGTFNTDGILRFKDGTVHSAKFKDGHFVDAKITLNLSEDEFISMNSDQDKTKHFTFKDLPIEKGVARMVTAAGVKIMVRGHSTVEVTCTGEFNGNVLKRGKVIVSDGNWMEGTFKDGVLIKGRAKTLDKYGTVYIGEIVNGLPHGKGKCTYSNETWFKGNFKYGNRMNGTHYSKDGKVIKVYK